MNHLLAHLLVWTFYCFPLFLFFEVFLLQTLVLAQFSRHGPCYTYATAGHAKCCILKWMFIQMSELLVKWTKRLLTFLCISLKHCWEVQPLKHFKLTDSIYIILFVNKYLLGYLCPYENYWRSIKMWDKMILRKSLWTYCLEIFSYMDDPQRHFSLCSPSR